jgi:hypothetical protein
MFTGRVDDLDFIANSDWCQAILRDQRGQQLVAVTKEPRMQTLLELAFSTGWNAEVYYSGDNPKVLTRVKVNRELHARARSRRETPLIASKPGKREGLDYVYWPCGSFDEGDAYIHNGTLYLYSDSTWKGHMDDCKNKVDPFDLSFNFEVQSAPGSEFWLILKMCDRNIGEGGAADNNGSLSWGCRECNARMSISS